MKCRHCSSPLALSLVDLGSAPPSNSYLTDEQLKKPEKWFPLSVRVCEECWLAQTEFSPPEELFDPEYAYFSSFSSSWLAHAERYVSDMIDRFDLGARSHVVEVAANDGYLLQYVKARDIPCTGVEPTASTAAAARAKGIPIVQEFFGTRLADTLVQQGKQADLMVANNVLAHVPDINDFVTGFARLLKVDGVATFEFPDLMRLVDETLFDTVYHEHYSYLSLTAVTRIFERHGLIVFDVEELTTHGGSLRVFARRADGSARTVSSRVLARTELEIRAGVTTKAYYQDFQAKTDRFKNCFLQRIVEAAGAGKSVAAYGAAAKGNTLMNYAGVRPDLIRFVVDRNPAKQNKYMPGSRIPIVDEAYLKQARPDYVIILPWNLRTEVSRQLDYVADWGGKLVTPADWA